MSEFRRFVSYIYRYKNGKKERNSGFAKVEVRNGILKLHIQLERTENSQDGLDVYGFVRKGEKQKGVYLGVMQEGSLPLFRLTVKNEQLGGTPYQLEDFAGLWIKGEKGENHITVWDEEPVTTMELESEIREKTEEMEEREERAEEKEEEEENGAVEEKEEVEAEAVEEKEKVEGQIRSAEEGTPDLEKTAAEIVKEGDQYDQYGVWKVVVEESPEAGEQEKRLNGVRALESADFTGKVKSLEKPLSKNEQRWELLLNRYGQMESLLKEEKADCVQITPRELSLFQSREWNPCKNHFIFYGYYHYRHLIFGRFPEGAYFLGVPGIFSPREQRTAQAFGFPCFHEGRVPKRGGCFGYWCRPVE